ncbi:MAG: glycosyltransferase family 2 protein [Deltaproteobacteria bacterium]|nr:glycosyltransferase family 2 protein [Deltaproteobacteria bacterium]
MNEFTPVVSVIMPCFNHGQYIDEAVASVLAQSYQNFEIIIIDDGSTDTETIQLLKNYTCPKTKVLRTPNKGPAAARNIGMSQAQGEYLCALDADDRLHPEFFQKSIALLENNPHIAFASCWIQMFGDENSLWKQDHCDLTTLLCECTVATPSLVRKSTALSIGGYDENPNLGYNEDWDFWLSLVEKGFRGQIIPEVLFYYRKQPNSRAAAYPWDETYLTSLRTIFNKHKQSYLDHIQPVINYPDHAIGHILNDNNRLEWQIHNQLLPNLTARRCEAERLKNKLFSHMDKKIIDEQKLENEVKSNIALRYEISALRSSMSWKITKPLRIIYDIFLKIKSCANSGIQKT